jgi:signal transduction histidine kinase
MSHSSPVNPPQPLALDRTPVWVQGRPWLRRLLVVITGVSISTKIMGIVLALTILFGLVVTVQVRIVMARALQEELHIQGVAVAGDLADHVAALITANDREGLDALLHDTVSNHPDIRYALILDNEGLPLASAFRSVEGVIESGGELPAEIMDADFADSEAQSGHLDYTNPEGRIHNFVIAIGPTGSENGGGELGTVRLALAETRVNESVDGVTEQMVLTTLLVAGVGILAALLLIWLLTRPILDLVTTTEQLRQGDLSVRAPHWTDDEIGELSDAFNQMVSELEVSQQTVIEKENARTHLLSRLISAQEEERKRIARELHDGVGQALTSILVHIKVLAQSQEPAIQVRMEELRQLVDETLADVRLLSRELRPSALDDLGLAAALERYVAEFSVRYPHLETDLHCTLPRRLPPNIETSLYRVIQEAMTNTARHSNATSLSVVVNERAGAFHAIIEDNGAGFDVESTLRAGSSVGLHSMNERVELLNGKLAIESSGDGTTVYVEIPIEAL